ncbi:MAG: hypothetical protein ABI861_04340 [Panacibacter sp.]
MDSKKLSIKIIVILCFVLLISVAKSYSQQFIRQQFYKAMAGKSLEEINNQLFLLKQSNINGKNAFEGTLLMKKADLVDGKKEKLNFFKSGKIKLEGIIAKDTSNAEFRFLRLQIQEHSPKLVKYKDNLERDKQFIIRSFRNLSPEIQQAILDYSKQSKILQPSDL